MRISDWSSDVCSSDLLSCVCPPLDGGRRKLLRACANLHDENSRLPDVFGRGEMLGAEEPQVGDGNPEAYAPLLARLQQDLLEPLQLAQGARPAGNGIADIDRKSTRLNSSHYCASRMPS